MKHLSLDETVPAVHLPGAHTKNGKDANIPLPSGFADELKNWVAGKVPDDPVLEIPMYDELLRALKKDLAHAKIPYRDQHGHVFDVHSLRKCLVTYLRSAKVDPR